MIQAIETRYNGMRFRSRAEARWAVFFEAAGIRFEYEAQGYVVDGRPYLPDFWLPDAKVWMEVKGDDPTPEEIVLCEKLAKQGGQPCLLAKGPPTRAGGIAIYWPIENYMASGAGAYRFADDRRDEGVIWLQSQTHAFVVIGKDKTTDHDREPIVFNGPTAKGYAAAASARFEHGESGSG
jgi:hypothetical protein